MREVWKLFQGVGLVFLLLWAVSATQGVRQPVSTGNKVAVEAHVYASKTVMRLPQDQAHDQKPRQRQYLEPLSDGVFSGLDEGWRQSVKDVVRTEKCAPYFAMIRTPLVEVPLLFEAQMIAESLCDTEAKGSSGELGLMQIMPKTRQWVCSLCNADDLLNPRMNIIIAEKFHKRLFEGCRLCTPQQILYRYNHGQNASLIGVRARSEEYVRKVDYARRALIAHNASS